MRSSREVDALAARHRRQIQALNRALLKLIDHRVSRFCQRAARQTRARQAQLQLVDKRRSLRENDDDTAERFNALDQRHDQRQSILERALQHVLMHGKVAGRGVECVVVDCTFDSKREAVFILGREHVHQLGVVATKNDLVEKRSQHVHSTASQRRLRVGRTVCATEFDHVGVAL